MPAQHIMMKGMKKPLVFYSVLAIKTQNYKVALNTSIPSDARLAIKLSFQYWTIQDKRISSLPILGETIAMDESNIYATTGQPIDLYTDIKLNFDFCVEAHCFDDIYAKSTSTEMEQNQLCTKFSITAMDERDKTIIKKWMTEASA